MKKSKPRKATIMTPIKDLKGKDTIEHYNAVLIEEIRSNSRLVIERMETLETTLTKKIEDGDRMLGERIDILEFAVKHHTKILGQHTKILDQHTKDITEIKTDMTEVKSSIKHLDEKVSNVEATVNHLDAKVPEKLDDHEQRIVTLEKSAILP